MEYLKTINDGVKSLLNKNKISNVPSWEFIKKESSDMTDYLKINQKTYPLYYWRFDPQIEAIARNAKKNIGGSVSMKISGLVPNNYGIDAFLYKALDISEWVLDSNIKKITAFINKNAMNLTLLMENEKVALLELGSCLPNGCEEQVRITAWGKEGLESTRVVSTKIKPQSVYLFSDNTEPYKYNDANLELYGLSLDDATKAVAIFKLLTDTTSLNFYKTKDEKLKFYIEKVYESNNTSESIEL